MVEGTAIDIREVAEGLIATIATEKQKHLIEIAKLDAKLSGIVELCEAINSQIKGSEDGKEG